MRSSVRAFLVILAFFGAGQSIAQAAELVMVDLRSCVFCAKFRREVAPTYGESTAGKVAPLRFVSPLKSWPDDLAQVRRAPYTPVFILVDRGKEVGRFAGYTDEQAFWTKLNSLLGELQHG